MDDSLNSKIGQHLAKFGPVVALFDAQWLMARFLRHDVYKLCTLRCNGEFVNVFRPNVVLHRKVHTVLLIKCSFQELMLERDSTNM